MDPKQPLRIGFVNTEDAANVSSWSGTPFQMLSNLRNQGVAVELFTPLDRRLRYALIPFMLMARLRKRGFVADRTPMMLHSYARQIERKLSTTPVDVLFAPSSIPFTTLNTSTPIVFWTDAVFHGIIGYFSGVYDNMAPRAIERSKRQEEMALGRCSAAVYASEWAAKTARTLTDPAKIHVLPFGSSLPVSTSAAAILARAREKRESRPMSCTLLFVGIDWKRKGGPIAIETARLMNAQGIKTKLQIVGPPQLAESLPEFVEQIGFVDKKTPEGQKKLIRLYEEADFFLLPTQAEAAGVVFCEASSLGLPSLTCDTGGVSDYIQTGRNGVLLSATATAAEFAQAATSLLNDPQTYEQLSISAYSEYEARLNWPASVARLIDICRSVSR